MKNNNNKNREKCIEKGKQCCEENEERKKIKKGKGRLQKWLPNNIEDYLKKEKDRKREYTKNRYQKIPEEDTRKLRQRKKNRICGITQEELQQRIDYVIEHLKELLKRLKS